MTSFPSPSRPLVLPLYEILTFLCLLPLAKADLRARVSPNAVCSDASPSGGEACTAERPFPLIPPSPVEAEDYWCACCGSEWAYEAYFSPIPCPASCGRKFCSYWCVAEHRRTNCTRRAFEAPSFAEFFSGPRARLTLAMSLAAVAVEEPFDVQRNSEDDFFSVTGMVALETSARCVAKHWGPECKTFSTARGRPVTLSTGQVVSGPPALRN